MRIVLKFKSLAKKVWYKISPVAKNLRYLDEQLKSIAKIINEIEVKNLVNSKNVINEVGLTIDNRFSNFEKNIDILSKEDIANALRNSDLVHINDFVKAFQQSDVHHHDDVFSELQQSELRLQNNLLEMIQQYALIQKSDAEELMCQYKQTLKNNSIDLIKQSQEFSYIVRQYVWDHQMSAASNEFNTDIYNSYKWLETQNLPEFIKTRFAAGSIGYELQKIAQQHHDKEMYVLTDLPDYNYPYRVISIEQVLEYSKKENALFVFLFRFDWNAVEAIKFFETHGLKFQAPPQISPMARYFHINKIAYETLVDEKLNNPRSHYCPIDFENIFQCLEATRSLDGNYVEIGTYQGASARAALNYMRRANIKRKAYFIDTYEGFNYAEAENSADSVWYGTHTETSQELVDKYISEYSNAKTIKANIITDGVPDEIEKIVLCNIDVDMYDAVYAALREVAPLVVPQGIIIAEDYGHTPWLIGAQYGVRKFLMEVDDFMPIYLSSGQMLLIKLKQSGSL